MNITGQQAEALAVFLCEVRPDWTKHYVVDALRKAYEINPDVERLTRVAIRAALSPKIRKPDVIGMRGEHWKAAADLAPEPATGGGRCVECHVLHSVGSPCGPLEQTPDWRTHLAAARAEVRPMKRYEGSGK